MNRTLEEVLLDLGIDYEKLSKGVSIVHFQIIGNEEEIAIGVVVNELVFQLPSKLKLALLECLSSTTDLLVGNDTEKGTMQ